MGIFHGKKCESEPDGKINIPVTIVTVASLNRGWPCHVWSSQDLPCAFRLSSTSTSSSSVALAQLRQGAIGVRGRCRRVIYCIRTILVSIRVVDKFHWHQFCQHPEQNVPSWAQTSPWTTSWRVVACTGGTLRNVRGLRWRGGMVGLEEWESERLAWDPNISNVWREPSVGFINNHYETPARLLHITAPLRIKVLEVSCGWPWREVLGCVTAAFSSSCSVLLHSATVRPCFCQWHKLFVSLAAAGVVQKGTDRLDCESKVQTDLPADIGGPKNSRVSRQWIFASFRIFLLGSFHRHLVVRHRNAAAAALRWHGPRLWLLFALVLWVLMTRRLGTSKSCSAWWDSTSRICRPCRTCTTCSRTCSRTFLLPSSQIPVHRTEFVN